MYCDHCEMKGHSRVDCNKLKYCTHCHKHGHLKDVCFQLIGYPINYKGKRLANNVSTDCGSLGKSNDNSCFVTSTQQSQQQYGAGFGASSVPQFTPDQYKQVLQMLNKPLIHEGNAMSTNINANAAGNFAGHSKFNSPSFDWIVDSGATDHMVGTKNVLTNESTVMSSGHVQLPNGDSSRVTHSGCSKLQGGDIVKNVLCVPDFNFNLLSVAKLTRQLNCCAIFYPDFFLLQDLLTGRVKEIGKRDGGLYIEVSSTDKH